LNNTTAHLSTNNKGGEEEEEKERIRIMVLAHDE
jgi:hypothetical protein